MMRPALLLTCLAVLLTVFSASASPDGALSQMSELQVKIALAEAQGDLSVAQTDLRRKVEERDQLRRLQELTRTYLEQMSARRAAVEADYRAYMSEYRNWNSSFVSYFERLAEMREAERVSPDRSPDDIYWSNNPNLPVTRWAPEFGSFDSRYYGGYSEKVCEAGRRLNQSRQEYYTEKDAVDLAVAGDPNVRFLADESIAGVDDLIAVAGRKNRDLAILEQQIPVLESHVAVLAGNVKRLEAELARRRPGAPLEVETGGDPEDGEHGGQPDDAAGGGAAGGSLPPSDTAAGETPYRYQPPDVVSYLSHQIVVDSVRQEGDRTTWTFHIRFNYRGTRYRILRTSVSRSPATIQKPDHEGEEKVDFDEPPQTVDFGPEYLTLSEANNFQGGYVAEFDCAGKPYVVRWRPDVSIQSGVTLNRWHPLDEALAAPLPPNTSVLGVPGIHMHVYLTPITSPGHYRVQVRVNNGHPYYLQGLYAEGNDRVYMQGHIPVPEGTFRIEVTYPGVDPLIVSGVRAPNGDRDRTMKLIDKSVARINEQDRILVDPRSDEETRATAILTRADWVANIGECLYVLEDYEQAAEFFQGAMDAIDASGLPRSRWSVSGRGSEDWWVRCLKNLAACAYARGDIQELKRLARLVSERVEFLDSNDYTELDSFTPLWRWWQGIAVAGQSLGLPPEDVCQMLRTANEYCRQAGMEPQYGSDICDNDWIAGRDGQ